MSTTAVRHFTLGGTTVFAPPAPLEESDLDSGALTGSDWFSFFAGLADAKGVAGDFAVYPEIDSRLKPSDPGLADIAFSATGTIGGTTGALSDIAITATLDPGGIDAYGIDLVEGQTYLFSTYGFGPDALPDTYLYVTDGDFNILAEDDDGNFSFNSLITYTASFTGTHYLAVGAYPGSGLSGDYALDAFDYPGGDVVGDTFAGAPELTIGTVAYGFIDEGPSGIYGPGYSEVDTYSFDVEAGAITTIQVSGGADYSSDYLDLPAGEIDPVIVVYDSTGAVVASSDDIAFPDNINSGLSFLSEEGGTFYLDVFSYSPWTGGYSIATSSVDLGDLDPLEALYWDSANNVPFDETNTAYVYFGEAGENFDQTADDGVSPMVTFGWNDFEIAQVMDALTEYEKILGVNYEITTDINQATFRLNTTSSEEYGAYFTPQDPGYGPDGQGIGIFNVDSGAWTFDEQQSLLRGGYSYSVILHEFGHAHGLAHPHDNGGGSEQLLGVSSFSDLGIFDLNQGVYTVMSYNDAWQLNPIGATPFAVDTIDNGWTATLSAFDIAALQNRYGVINPYAEGDTVYELKDTQELGTYYETIWDTGGTDAISYDGKEDVQIDLLAATLDYSPTGGGAISFVNGVWGGFTIAAGVVIENAISGRGDDVLLGNDVGNYIESWEGDDYVMGRGGDDFIRGRNGNDTLEGNDGDDFIDGGGNADLIYGGDGNDTLDGGNVGDTIYGGDGFDNIYGANGRDMLFGDAGNDRIDGGNGNDTIQGGSGFDHIGGGNGSDVLTGGGGKDHFVFDMDDGNDIVTDFQSGHDKVSLLEDGDYSLSDDGVSSTLIFGDTKVTFLGSILTDGDIGIDPDSGSGFFA